MHGQQNVKKMTRKIFKKNESGFFSALIPSELNDDVKWFWSNFAYNT